MSVKRLFIAIPLPEHIKSAIKEVAEKLSATDKIIPEKNWHITVHFLGDTPEEEIPELISRVENISSTSKPFNLRLQDVIIKRSGPRAMIWVRAEETDEFIKIAKQVAEVSDGKEKNKPVPHITLSRLRKKPFERNALPIRFPNDLSWRVNEIELWESSLGAGNAQYMNLHTFKLKTDE